MATVTASATSKIGDEGFTYTLDVFGNDRIVSIPLPEVSWKEACDLAEKLQQAAGCSR